MNEYIIGCGDPPPDWCSNRLMPYRKPDNSTGFVFYAPYRDFELSAGDRLILEGKRITVKRKEQQ